MKNKKGVSLIVLVITIIVIIILAAAVILSLNNNNPIDNAKTATLDSDKDAVKSAVSLFIGNYMAKTTGMSPFVGTTPISIGTVDRTDHGTPATAADATPQDIISWANIGMTGKPANMVKLDVKVNPVTGDITYTPLP